MRYEYLPKPDRRPAAAVVLALSAVTFCCIMPTFEALKAPLRAIGAAAALAALMVAARFLLCRYAYTVTAHENGAWLVVTDLRRERSLSVFEARGGRLEKYTPALRRELKDRGVVTVNRCVELLPREAYVFIPASAAGDPPEGRTDRDERCALKFQPDETMRGILERIFSE